MIGWVCVAVGLVAWEGSFRNGKGMGVEVGISEELAELGSLWKLTMGVF